MPRKGALLRRAGEGSYRPNETIIAYRLRMSSIILSRLFAEGKESAFQNGTETGEEVHHESSDAVAKESYSAGGTCWKSVSHGDVHQVSVKARVKMPVEFLVPPEAKHWTISLW